MRDEFDIRDAEPRPRPFVPPGVRLNFGNMPMPPPECAYQDRAVDFAGGGDRDELARAISGRTAEIPPLPPARP